MDINIVNFFRIKKVKWMIIHFKRVEEIYPIIRKCEFSAKKRFEGLLIDLKIEFCCFYFRPWPITKDGDGSNESLRCSMGSIRQKLLMRGENK